MCQKKPTNSGKSIKKPQDVKVKVPVDYSKRGNTVIGERYNPELKPKTDGDR